jgi:RPA family protein
VPESVENNAMTSQILSSPNGGVWQRIFIIGVVTALSSAFGQLSHHEL